MIVQLAHEGGIDAVFDVPAELIRTSPRDPKVVVALADDPAVQTTGRVREVAPQADAATRTFEVKVGLVKSTDYDALGYHCNGPDLPEPRARFVISASALTEAQRPACGLDRRQGHAQGRAPPGDSRAATTRTAC